MVPGKFLYCLQWSSLWRMKLFVIWQNNTQHASQWMPLCPPRCLIFCLLCILTPKLLPIADRDHIGLGSEQLYLDEREDMQTTWKSHRIFKSSHPEWQQAHRKTGGTYGSHSHKSKNPGFSWVRELRENQRWHFNTAQNSISESGFTSPGT